MSTLSKKIDFAILISVENANPNGDPLCGNRPREDYDGYGEISDVCLKRKIRNRLMDLGEPIFVQSNDYRIDGYDSLKARAEGCETLKKVKKNRDELKKVACEQWLDVRSFGQVFAFKGDFASVGVRGPVTISIAKSMDPIDIITMQIVKSVNNESSEKKGPETMGLKHRVAFGLYLAKGSINCQLAEKTGFSDEDAEKIKEAMRTLLENDASSARPEGSMEVCALYWWEQEGKTPKYSSAKVQRSLQVALKEGVTKPTRFEDYDVQVTPLDGVMLQILS